MNKVLKSPIANVSNIPAVPEKPAAASRNIEVAQVLEHISSRYRWELLEITTAKQKENNSSAEIGKK